MVVVVTGAGRGLGYEIVAALLRGGRKVVACVRTPSPKLDELKIGHEGLLFVVRMDVDKEEEARAAARAVNERFGSITHIVNNAAVLRGRGTGAADLPMADFEESFATNTFGPLLVTKHFLPLLVKDSGIQVLNISSTSGSIARAGRPDYSYAMSKAALNMYTVMLRNELSARGIAVAAIHPGWIHTDMGGKNAPGDPAASARFVVGLLDGSIAPPADSAFFDVDLNPLPF